jgi:hypothetical protein
MDLGLGIAVHARKKIISPTHCPSVPSKLDGAR